MTSDGPTLPLFVDRVSERGGRYDPVNDDEAAAVGRALLAELRGEELTPSQRALLLRSRSRSRLDARAPTPVVDASETLLTLGRGEEAEVRIRWRRYKGSSPFLDIRRFERAAGGRMRPTRQGVTIRARELGRVMSTLVAAARRLGWSDGERERQAERGGDGPER